METVKDVVEALTKAQAEMQTAHKGATNPHFKSKYADLAEIIETVKGPFMKNGLCFTQEPTETERGWVLVTKIRKADQFISGSTPILPRTNSMTDFGAALTYARRQGLQTLVGVAADDDTDGDTAQESVNTAMPTTPTSFTPPVLINPATYKVPFGKKYLGKTFNQMTEDEISSFSRFLTDSAQKDGKPLGKQATEFVANAEVFLKGVPIQENFLTPPGGDVSFQGDMSL